MPAGSPTGPAGCCADAGARSTAVWPDEASLSLWDLPPGQLITTLLDLIEHGTGGAAYYADVMEALVALAVEAPRRAAAQRGRTSWPGWTRAGCRWPTRRAGQRRATWP